MAGNFQPIVLMAALKPEVRPFLRLVRAARNPTPLFSEWAFTVGEAPGLVVLHGMGARAASEAATYYLKRIRPRALLAVGFGGALSPALPAGAVVVGRSFWAFDSQKRRLQPLESPPFPKEPETLCSLLRNHGLPSFVGALITTESVMVKEHTPESLKVLPHGVLDLETAVLVSQASRRSLPFLAIRAVTDEAGQEIPSFLRQALAKRPSPKMSRILAQTALHPWSWPMVFRLWRQSLLAARRLAQALAVVLQTLSGHKDLPLPDGH